VSTAEAQFVSGLITMGFLIAGLLFLRFWTRTRDLLFAAFAAAFWLLAANQALVAIIDVPREERSWIYLLRVAAFALIIAAVIWKNRTSRRLPKRPDV
jgi:membrane protein DedA with SNARE-associated domain